LVAGLGITYRGDKVPGGLGDHVADALAAFGITKERLEAAMGRPCGCDERQQLLNQVGYRLGIGDPPVDGAAQSPDFHDERPGPQSEA